VSKPALILAAFVLVGAAVASYLARTDAFAPIAWFTIGVLAWGVVGIIYGLDKEVRTRRARRLGKDA
jgi:hypothetical protein